MEIFENIVLALLHDVDLIDPLCQSLILHLLLHLSEISETFLQSHSLVIDLCVESSQLSFSRLLEFIKVFLNFVDESFVLHCQRN